MSVLLVNPIHNGKSDIPPLGLACIAAVLLENDIGVTIIDLDVYRGQDAYGYVTEQLNLKIPKIVGVTAMSDSFQSALAVCRIVKEFDPAILTVLGGIHGTVLYDTILKANGAIDVIVRGEGEISFLEIVNTVLTGMPLSEIKGVSFRDDDRIVHNAHRELVRDLDAFPLPSHDLIKSEDYRTRSISSSRGCFHDCTFCSIQSLYHNVVRLRSIDTVIEEIEGLVQCGAQRIMFTDDNFTFSFKRVKHLCSEIVRRRFHEKVVFYAEGRIDDICKTPIMAQVLSDAGFKGLYIGAESGSREILKYYRKDITPDIIARGVSYCVEQNLMPVINFILYGPRDTVETMKETINCAKRAYENGAEIVYGETLIPYPGTPIKEELEREGKYRESQGIFFFESYTGMNMDRTLRLCNAARDMAYLTHKNDLIFETIKPYYELTYLEDLLETRIPREFEDFYRCQRDNGTISDVIERVYEMATELTR